MFTGCGTAATRSVAVIDSKSRDCGFDASLDWFVRFAELSLESLLAASLELPILAVF